MLIPWITLPVKTLGFLQRQKCEHKSGLSFIPVPKQKSELGTQTNKYSVRTWTYNIHTIQYCFLYESKLHYFKHKALREWGTNIWWTCEWARSIWQAWRRSESLCLQGFGVKTWRKKDHLGTLVQMGDTPEINSTAGYGMDSSGSLQVQGQLLKIRLQIFRSHTSGKLLKSWATGSFSRRMLQHVI